VTVLLLLRHGVLQQYIVLIIVVIFVRFSLISFLNTQPGLSIAMMLINGFCWERRGKFVYSWFVKREFREFSEFRKFQLSFYYLYND